MKGNPLSKRLIVLLATVALLMIGAVPVSAAPGGVPGPPPGHEKVKDKAPKVDDGESDVKELPAHAKAYGKRIKDAYGIPFGHLQQCAGVADEEPEAADATEEDITAEDDEKVKKALEACPEGLVFPNGETGAKALWESVEPLFVVTEAGLLILGV